MRNNGARNSFCELSCWLAPFAAAQANPRVSLPHTDQNIGLDRASVAKLANILAHSDASTFDPEPRQQLVNLLPPSLRDSCRDFVETVRAGRGGADWTVRLLHALHEGTAFHGILAYHCGANTSSDSPDFSDERLALLTLQGSTGTLTFIPIEDPCDNCSSRVYAVSFLEAFPVAKGQLFELEAIGVPDNDGPDSSSRNERLWVTVPQGRIALQVDSRTEFDGYDDESEASYEKICHAKIQYRKDQTGSLTEILTDTTCTENKVQKPSERVRYAWDSATARFQKTGAERPNNRASEAH